MDQVPHIFRKDVRRHSPEILICLLFLVLFTRHELSIWRNPREMFSASPFFALVALGRYISFFLVLAWAFLILRVVHSETLVGDRQWWITKPYIWWQLLLAKLLLIFVFIFVPLFHVQLFLLHYAGFSVLHNLGRILLIQIGLPFVLLVFTFTLASLTKNLAQALLGIGIVVGILMVGLWVDSLSTSQMTGDSYPFVDEVETLLLFGSAILISIWQFARRRTVASRVTLAVSIAIVTAFSLMPLSRAVEQSYPLVDPQNSPVRLSVSALPASKPSVPSWLDVKMDAVLSIPLIASGVAPTSAVLINGANLTADSAEDGHWTHGWANEYGVVWPGTQSVRVTYQLKRDAYDRIKTTPLNLHLDLALTEYERVDTQTLLLPPTAFRDPHLGVCLVLPAGLQSLQCTKPFHAPAYAAFFDAPNSPCSSSAALPNGIRINVAPGYAWSGPTEEAFPDPGLNPLVQYSLAFTPIVSSPKPDDTTAASYTVAVCPGAEIQIARPVFKRRFRLQLDLRGVALQSLNQWQE
jgi:hypothetical protein